MSRFQRLLDYDYDTTERVPPCLNEYVSWKTKYHTVECVCVCVVLVQYGTLMYTTSGLRSC